MLCLNELIIVTAEVAATYKQRCTIQNQYVRKLHGHTGRSLGRNVGDVPTKQIRSIYSTPALRSPFTHSFKFT
jgi:hypothetical protein